MIGQSADTSQSQVCYWEFFPNHVKWSKCVNYFHTFGNLWCALFVFRGGVAWLHGAHAAPGHLLRQGESVSVCVGSLLSSRGRYDTITLLTHTEKTDTSQIQHPVWNWKFSIFFLIRVLICPCNAESLLAYGEWWVASAPRETRLTNKINALMMNLSVH